MPGGHRHSQYCLKISGIPGNAWFPQLTVTYIHKRGNTLSEVNKGSVWAFQNKLVIRDCSLNTWTVPNFPWGGGVGGFRQIFCEKTSGPPSNFAKNSVAPTSDLAK